jgi:polysaccharide export outer membrane protein
MRKLIFSITWTSILILSCASCRSTRDMKFFQNMEDHELTGLAVKPSEYLIKPDDNLYIDIQSMNPEVEQVFNPSKSNLNGGTQQSYGDLTGQFLNGYQVNDKGMIRLPVIGEVSAADKTEEGAKIVIQQKVDEYYKNATVKVKILTYKISILGEVRNPGVYHNYNKSITILEAISMANGTSDYANVRKVLVIRPTPKGNKSFRLDLTKKEMLTSEAYYLLPNDVVYIEPDKYKNFNLNTTVYSLALSAITTAILILTYMKIH